MAESFTLVCTLSPRPGKLERVSPLGFFTSRKLQRCKHSLTLLFCQLKELLTSLAQNVHANEKGCLKYVVLEPNNPNGDQVDMVLIEEFVE